MNILLIQGHPDKESYCFALSQAYKKGALAAGAEVEEIVVADLDFNPNLQHGYRQRTELEPDLLKAQELILWANHIVMVHPVWWGSVPALLKGFFDRVLLPGFAFKKHEGSKYTWDRLLKGRSAHIIATADQPGWFYRLRYRRPSYHMLKGLVFEFCGVSPVRSTFIGPLRLSEESYRERWLEKVQILGEQQR